MDTSEERIREYEQIIWLTHYKMYDLTNRWARNGVKSNAMMDSSYVKRRVTILWPNRNKDTDTRDKILRAIKILKRLKRVINAEADNGMC